MAQIAVLVSIVLNTASGAFHSVTAGKWNYDYNSTNTVCTTTNKCGPDNWHYINSPTNHCNGTHQSPININRVVVDTTLTYPDMYAANGGCSKWTQFVDDHAFETSFVESGCTSLSLAFKGVNYTLQQMHFHSPSEHTIGGGFADAEVRCR
jgi:carbonic anhydrase